MFNNEQTARFMCVNKSTVLKLYTIWLFNIAMENPL